VATISKRDREQTRQERIHAIIDRRDYSSAEMEEKFAPGSYGCHEALHVASMLEALVDERLCDHPAVLLNPEWFALAKKAQEALFALYQAIGDAHLGSQGGGSED
jgi:hypothetical protein